MAASKKAEALYDFKGNAEQRQLSFKKGDLLNITNQYDNGWWAGELNGTLGYFPASYVKLVDGAAGAAKPAAPAASPKPTATAAATPSASSASLTASNSANKPAAAVAASPKPTAVAGVAQAAAASQQAASAVSPRSNTVTQPSGNTSPRGMSPSVSQTKVAPSTSNPPKPAPQTVAAKTPSIATPAPTSARGVPSTPKANAAAQDIAELDALISQLERDAQELNRLLN